MVHRMITALLLSMFVVPVVPLVAALAVEDAAAYHQYDFEIGLKWDTTR